MSEPEMDAVCKACGYTYGIHHGMDCYTDTGMPKPLGTKFTTESVIPAGFKWKVVPKHWVCTADSYSTCSESVSGQMVLTNAECEAICVKCAVELFGIGVLEGSGIDPATLKLNEPINMDDYFDVPEMHKYKAKWGYDEFDPDDGYMCYCYYTARDGVVGESCHKPVSADDLFFFQIHNGKPQFSGYAWTAECAEKFGLIQGIKGPADEMGASKTCLGCGENICETCAVCHKADCPFVEKRVVTAAQKQKYAYLCAKTQKARGYVTLAATELKVPKPFRVIMSEDDIDETVRMMNGRQGFIRPCPMRPRHGFVDSRPIEVNANSKQEISELLKTAIAADDEGHAELLLMPFIESAYNAIVTPNRIAVGPGHDGATSGHGSKDFPLSGVPFKEITDGVLEQARIGRNEDAYIEAVVNKSNQVYFTQIRAGVKIAPTVGADFVPYAVRVNEVIEASGDLLEWEKQTKLIKRGTVVCHLGGTLISHYGVHCMQNDIPVFTSRRPNIGEVLEVVSKVEKPNPEAVLRGLGIGALLPLNIEESADKELFVYNGLIAMMTILHNSAAMGGENGFWLGYAVALMYRAGMAASHGEARHKLNSFGGSRESIYRLALKNFFDGRNTLGHAQWKFQNNTWSQGYGGKAWAKCTQAIIEMDNAVRQLYLEPTTPNVAALVDKLNTAVNQAHNGGWWLNKFINQNYFTKASQQSLETVVSAGAAMFKSLELSAGLEDKAKLLMEDWGTSPDIAVVNGKLQCQVQVTKKPDEIVQAYQYGPWKGMCSPYSVNKTPDPENYIGVYCEICGKTYPSLVKDDLHSGMYCSDGCTGLVGWTQDGLFAYPISSDIADEDVDDPEPNEDEDPNGTEYEPKPHGETSFDDGDSETPGMIKIVEPMMPGKGLMNVNGGISPGDAEIYDVQCNWHNKYQLIHVQYKIKGKLGYKSCNVDVPSMADKAELISTLLVKPSYSGSGKGYAVMKVKHWYSHWRKLYIPELKLLIGLQVENNTLLDLEWEKNIDGPTPQEETKSENIEQFDDEIPF